MPNTQSWKFLKSGLVVLGAVALGLWRGGDTRALDPAPAPLPLAGPLGATWAAAPATVPAAPHPGADGRLAGPERERRFFDDWHGKDYGAILPPEVLQQMRAEIDALPQGAGGLLSSDGWSLLGPSGMKAPGHTNLYSGRVLDLASRNTSGELDIWIAAASGGLWHFNGHTGVYTPLTETLPTQAVSTVSVDPANPLNMVIGTGEYGVRGGLGIFRSTDGGATWQTTNANATLVGEVHRIRHVSSTTLLCAASKALLRSTDSGATWSVVFGYRSFDVAVHPTNPDTVYTTIITATQGQVRRSVDGGATFPAGVGVSVSERGAVALCRSQPWVVYAAFANPDTLGFGLNAMVMTPNGGAAWYVVNEPDDYMSGQGWYDNVVAVDPDNPGHVFVAGVYLRETTNGGASWTSPPSDMAVGLHPDYHAMEWLLASQAAVQRAGGGGEGVIQGGSAALMIGHDGGWSYETGGVFNSIFNNVPITQYTHVRAAPPSRLVVGGGSQDNGMSITTDGGANWFFRAGGDGSDLSIDPSNTARMWNEVGVFVGGPLLFRRQRTEDSGVTWADKNAGITAQGNWYTDVDNDKVSPVYLYSNADNFVYRSQDYGDSWTAIGTFSTTVRSVDVGLYTNLPDAAVWAVLDQATTGDRVYCWNGASFDQVDAGLPASVTIRCVIPHPREPNTAFALVNGFSAPGQKIFRTKDRGASWENVTGNLPNVPLGGIVAHPTDDTQLFVGSEAGSFRGFKSAGQWYWIDWNQNLPKAVIVSDMTWADELATTGKFWVIAGTYGRSMYQREIADLDVSAVPPRPGDGPGLMLAQNVPNPVRSSSATRIAFNLPKPAPVKLRVFDVSGRVVATLADEALDAGPHEYAFTPDGVVPGVYFYRLEAGGSVLSRKMIVRR